MQNNNNNNKGSNNTYTFRLKRNTIVQYIRTPILIHIRIATAFY